jgi:hypothetical protein
MTAAWQLIPERPMAMDDQESCRPAEAGPMERAAPAAAIVELAVMLAAESALYRVHRQRAADLAEAVWPGLDPDLLVEPGGTGV